MRVLQTYTHTHTQGGEALKSLTQNKIKYQIILSNKSLNKGELLSIPGLGKSKWEICLTGSWERGAAQTLTVGKQDFSSVPESSAEGRVFHYSLLSSWSLGVINTIFKGFVLTSYTWPHRAVQKQSRHLGKVLIMSECIQWNIMNLLLEVGDWQEFLERKIQRTQRIQRTHSKNHARRKNGFRDNDPSDWHCEGHTLTQTVYPALETRPT